MTAARKPAISATFRQFVRSLGVSLTPAQDALYATLFDNEPVHDTELGQALFGFAGEVPRLARKTKVMVKGARIGGTRFGSTETVRQGLRVDDNKLAEGEPLFVAYVGPDMRIARQGMTFARSTLNASPALKRLIVSDSTDLIVIRRPDGREVHFVCLPATAGGSALRGRWYAAVHFLEFAFFRDSNFVVNDLDLYRAVRARTKGAIIIESTPWVESGLLYELHRDNFANPTTATVAVCPTRLMRPDDQGILDDVEAEYIRDADQAANEYGAQFLTAGAAIFFDEASIKAAVDDRLPSESAVPDDELASAGGDIGLVRDSSALAVVSCNADEQITLRRLLEITPKKGSPLKLSRVIGEFCDVLDDVGIKSFVADAHNREAAKEYAEARGVDVDMAPAGPGGLFDVFEATRRALREGRLHLPNHPRLFRQMRQVVSKPLPGGGWTIAMPRRTGLGHGDLVSALTLAVHAAAHPNVDCHADEFDRIEIDMDRFMSADRDLAGINAATFGIDPSWVGRNS